MEENNDTTLIETATGDGPMSLADLKPKMEVTGTVTRLELYGAFIDIGVGVNALIHISQLGKEHVNRVSDVLAVGDEVKVWVDKVVPERNQVMVTMIEPLAVEWRDLKTGQEYTGTVTRIENYGAFVDIGAEREGLVHISEISHDYVKHPSEALSVGDEVRVQVLGFSKRKRRIDLSIKNLMEKPETEARPVFAQQTAVVDDYYDDEDESEMPTAMEMALRKAMGDDSVDAMVSPRRKKSGRKGKRRKRRRRETQDDLLSRTLHFQSEN